MAPLPPTTPIAKDTFFPPAQQNVLKRRLTAKAGDDKSLAMKLALGSGAAALVSIPLSMGVTVIDRSVTLFANGKAPSLGSALLGGMKNLARQVSE